MDLAPYSSAGQKPQGQCVRRDAMVLEALGENALPCLAHLLETPALLCSWPLTLSLTLTLLPSSYKDTVTTLRALLDNAE